MTIDPLTYTAEQAAEALQISVTLVRSLIHRHEIPVVRLGDRVLIPISALEIFLDERALAMVRRDAVTAYLTGAEDSKPIELGLAGRTQNKTASPDGLTARSKPSHKKGSST